MQMEIYDKQRLVGGSLILHQAIPDLSLTSTLPHAPWSASGRTSGLYSSGNLASDWVSQIGDRSRGGPTGRKTGPGIYSPPPSLLAPGWKWLRCSAESHIAMCRPLPCPHVALSGMQQSFLALLLKPRGGVMASCCRKPKCFMDLLVFLHPAHGFTNDILIRLPLISPLEYAVYFSLVSWPHGAQGKFCESPADPRKLQR